MAAFIFDIDGTLVDWHTNDWMPGAIDMLRELKQEGHQIIFTTMRGHQDVDKLWSIENTMSLLEQLGIEYRILFGVPSPRMIIDDSGVYAINCKGVKEWPAGSAHALIEKTREVANGLAPGQV